MIKIFYLSLFKAVYIIVTISLSNFLIISNSVSDEKKEIIKLVNIKLNEIGEFQEPKSYPEGFLKSCNNIIGGYHLSDNNGLSDTNEKFSEDSWFWPYINKKINYYTIEVYDLDFKEIKNLYNLTKKKLND